MNRLFIEYYLDEDIDILIAELVRNGNFPATTARDEGQLGRSDPEQLDYATSLGKTIVTHNRSDYQALAEKYFAEGRTHAGIIVVLRRSSPYLIAKRLVEIANNVTADEMQNQIRYI